MVGSIIFTRKFEESKIWYLDETGINKSSFRIKIELESTMRVQLISLAKGKGVRSINRKAKMEPDNESEQTNVSNKEFWDSRVNQIRVVEFEVK